MFIIGSMVLASSFQAFGRHGADADHAGAQSTVVALVLVVTAMWPATRAPASS
jgi:hypothetical protein